MTCQLYQGDCLAVMDDLIKDGVIVDSIIADLPYGISACHWDSIIPFKKYIMTQKGKKQIPVYKNEWVFKRLHETVMSIQKAEREFEKRAQEGMWCKINKLIKSNGVIALFGNEPFSTHLRMSNMENYKYDWIWSKKSKKGFLNAKKRPLKTHEKIHIFSNGVPLYFPIKEIRDKIKQKGSGCVKKGGGNTVYGEFENPYCANNEYYPADIIEISNAVQLGKVHPTEKPVALLEYLIKTYTKEDETILDFTMGSGTAGMAAKRTNRNFIGIELDPEYFELAKNRIDSALKDTQNNLFD